MATANYFLFPSTHPLLSTCYAIESFYSFSAVMSCYIYSYSILTCIITIRNFQFQRFRLFYNWINSWPKFLLELANNWDLRPIWINLKNKSQHKLWFDDFKRQLDSELGSPVVRSCKFLPVVHWIVDIRWAMEWNEYLIERERGISDIGKEMNKGFDGNEQWVGGSGLLDHIIGNKQNTSV